MLSAEVEDPFFFLLEKNAEHCLTFYMNGYLLFRLGGNTAEGPYSDSQLQKMWRRGELHVRDDVCRKGQRRFSIERLMLRWERRDAWKERFRGLGWGVSRFCGLGLFLAIIFGVGWWFVSLNDPRNQKYGPILSGAERQGVHTSLHARWNDAAAVVESVGMRVIRDGDSTTMRVIMPSEVASEFTDYQLKAMAQKLHGALGDSTIVTLEDEQGNRLSKAWMWGSSVSR